ncbi:MAG: HAMP domain-containing sensor histidine kinase [Saprospiraceae bacterium]
MTYIVMIYMLMAFTWWSVLLFTKNNDAFRAKVELLRMGMTAEGKYVDDISFQKTQQFAIIEKKYMRQEWMILGEAAVFICSLLVGIWLINKAYNQMVESELQRRNFLLSITHELKSPIASIKLTLETFLKRELPKEQVNKLSNNALKESERLNTLVDNLLLAARVESSYQPIFEKFSLSVLLSEIVESFKDQYPQVKFSYTHQSEIVIRADKLGITSVVSNLIENSIKYAANNPTVMLQLSAHNGQVVLQVSDLGIGISDKEKAKIFQRFYRIGNEDTRHTKGTGLGLYIVQQIVQAHQGTITVEDNKPKGTKFIVVLP